MPYTYFENQSDARPQSISPTSSPAHPILRNNGHDITVYPDHMHEGNALDVVGGWDYTQPSPYGDTSKSEFRQIASHREMPRIIAIGQTKAQASYYVGDPAPTVIDATVSGAFNVNTLSVYDGRVAGIGRVVTGSTFHHYLDINLSGASDVDTTTLNSFVGGEAEKGQGLQTNTSAFADIQAVYVNIANWLARPTPAISLVLESQHLQPGRSYRVTQLPRGHFRDSRWPQAQPVSQRRHHDAVAFSGAADAVGARRSASAAALLSRSPRPRSQVTTPRSPTVCSASPSPIR